MTKSEATRIRLAPQERAALEAAAARSHGGNVSEAIRLAIRAMYMPDADLARPKEGRVDGITKATL